MSEPTAWPEPPAAERLPGDWGAELSAAPSAASTAAVRRGITARQSALAGVMVALVACVGVAAWIAYTNKTRADRWQARSGALQRNVTALNGIVVRRTVLLNARARQLNDLAGKVQQSQSALSQSEGDVQNLEGRQRALANEKAQLEDERSALTQVASAYITCKSDLENVIQAIANSDYGWIDANGGTAQSDCASADSSLQGFLGSYPNG